MMHDEEAAGTRDDHEGNWTRKISAPIKRPQNFYGWG